MVEVILATQGAEVRGDLRESETSPSDAGVFNKKTQVEVEKWPCLDWQRVWYSTLERKQCGALRCLAGHGWPL